MKGAGAASGSHQRFGHLVAAHAQALGNGPLAHAVGDPAANPLFAAFGGPQDYGNDQKQRQQKESEEGCHGGLGVGWRRLERRHAPTIAPQGPGRGKLKSFEILC